MNVNNIFFRPLLIIAPGILAGAEKVVLTGVESLYDLGLNPLMIIIKETRYPEFAENFQRALPSFIEYAFIESTGALDFRLPKKLGKILSDQTLPVVLHTHGFKALATSYVSRKGRKHIHTHHGNTSHTLKVKIYESLAMIIMKQCHCIITVSSQMNIELKKSLSPYKNIITSENMLSIIDAEKTRKERTKKLNTSDKIIKLIFVGRLSPEKGLLNFLEYFCQFRLRARFHLTILGDGIELNLVKKFISDHDLNELITMHGFVSDPTLFYISSDILIMPSFREGLPMTLIEALAIGIPVIANNVGGISNLVIHNQNGYLTNIHSLEDWNQALENSILNYKKWQKNSEAKAREVEKKFSSKLWAKNTYQSYKNLFL